MWLWMRASKLQRLADNDHARQNMVCIDLWAAGANNAVMEGLTL
jgi:hypothetical protein